MPGMYSLPFYELVHGRPEKANGFVILYGGARNKKYVMT
jgi:hypothetical protein